VDDYDVAIVGAGPAGSWAACRLALAGARVALIDGSHPREKPCGGGVTGRAFELIASVVTPASLPIVAVRSASFIAGGRNADVTLGADVSGFPALAIVARRDFDGALLAAAARAGADHLPARVTAVEPATHGWTVTAGGTRLTSSWLIGADGAASMVRRRVSSPFQRSELSVATGYFVTGTGREEIVIDFDDTPTGYVWAFPRSDHLAVGACGQADCVTSPAMLTRAARWIERHIPRASMQRYSWPIPSLGLGALMAEQPAGSNWMLVGDAAGLVDPITREGIYFALLSAELAAVSLGGSAAVAQYSNALRVSAYHELQRAARLKARFFRPDLLQLLVRALNRSTRVRAIMADLVSGRQTYAGLRSRLLATLELRLMLDFFRM
jgi:geranylgeranyl reductase family protein